jgi:N-acetylglutamate synthase-like GNAT family acetyltransferase
VFVRRSFRRRGIASALCEVVVDKARGLGFERLYLFTPDQQALYARLGWSTVERVEWRGLSCDLMVKLLRP